jgi:hypothetical protein
MGFEEKKVGRFTVEGSTEGDLWFLVDEQGNTVGDVFVNHNSCLLTFTSTPEDGWSPEDLRAIADFLEEMRPQEAAKDAPEAAKEHRRCRQCGSRHASGYAWELCSCGGVLERWSQLRRSIMSRALKAFDRPVSYQVPEVKMKDKG